MPVRVLCFNETLSQQFGGMYDHTLFSVCKSPYQTNQATCTMDSQFGDCRWPFKFSLRGVGVGGGGVGLRACMWGLSCKVKKGNETAFNFKSSLYC